MTKKDVKLLKTVYRRPRTRAYLLRHFSDDQISRLMGQRYIRCNQEPPHDSSGFICGDVSPDAVYDITDPEGIAVKESYDWFDLQYFVTHLLIPLLIGIFSGIGTYLISSALF
ncbi:MAG: hypothetical protein K6B44_07740 [Lachnospiraceae bacterium]|nr:hypothetical protein [Lachnospiraceae bacterium]